MEVIIFIIILLTIGSVAYFWLKNSKVEIAENADNQKGNNVIMKKVFGLFLTYLIILIIANFLEMKKDLMLYLQLLLLVVAIVYVSYISKGKK